MRFTSGNYRKKAILKLANQIAFIDTNQKLAKPFIYQSINNVKAEERKQNKEKQNYQYKEEISD